MEGEFEAMTSGRKCITNSETVAKLATVSLMHFLPDVIASSLVQILLAIRSY
jgi:hypothetical protein